MSHGTHTINKINYKKIINILSWFATFGIIGSVIYLSFNMMDNINPTLSLGVSILTPAGFVVLLVNSLYKKDYQALIFFIVCSVFTGMAMFEYIFG